MAFEKDYTGYTAYHADNRMDTDAPLLCYFDTTTGELEYVYAGEYEIGYILSDEVKEDLTAEYNSYLKSQQI